MAYKAEQSYYLRAFRGKSNFWLNRSGSGSMVKHQKADIYKAMGSSDQKFKVHLVSGGCQLLSNLNTAYGLNIYGSKSWTQCDFFPVKGNERDALIDLITVDAENNLYKIKLVNHNLYLTAISDTARSKVVWAKANTIDSQVWQFCEVQSSKVTVTEGTGTTETKTEPVKSDTIEIPMTFCLSQKSSPITWIKNSGCALTCGVDLASYYEKRNYTFNDFASCWSTSSGYSWRTPNWNFADNDWTPKGLNATDTISYIKRYIKSGIPVACHCINASGSGQHWVLAYSCTEGTGWASIGVLDPADGKKKTLEQAMKYSSVTAGIDRLRARYKLTT